MIRRKFGHLLFSMFLSFSFLSLSVFADENDYGISLLSIADEGYIGYVGLVDTGYQEWDSLVSLIDSWNPSQYNNYIIQFGNDSTGRLLGNVSSNGDGTYTAQSVNTFVCSSLTTGCVARSNTSSSVNIRTSLMVSMYNVPQDNYYSDVVNWNAITWDQAKAYYINSDSSQVTNKDILDAIVDGTDDSADSADFADSANSDLKDVIDEYDSIEQSYIQDFNTNLDNIDVGGFSWDSSFLTSASWVTTQFNELVMETPFESLITFSLIIGITLYLIGRYKG